MSTSYFTDDSMLRRVIRETVVAFSAPRTLLMQAAHPVAFAGFFAHTGSLADPYARLRRTAEVMDLVAWGPREDADAASAERGSSVPLGFPVDPEVAITIAVGSAGSSSTRESAEPGANTAVSRAI